MDNRTAVLVIPSEPIPQWEIDECNKRLEEILIRVRDRLLREAKERKSVAQGVPQD